MAPLGNEENPLDELMFIQLTLRTRNAFSANLYRRLRTAVNGRWERLERMDLRTVRKLLRPGGMADVKARRLKVMVRTIRESFGVVTLDPLRSMDDGEAEAFLTSLHGVGPKAARCVLLYSLDRAVFPVDSNCRRIMRRLGLLPESISDKASHDYLQELVPRRIRHSLHVNMVHHGKSHCRAVNPGCDSCPLLGECCPGQNRTVA